MLPLGQDTPRKKRVEESNTIELDTSNSNKYYVKANQNSVVYTKKSKSDHLPGLHYLVAWKNYLNKENIWEPDSTVQYLKKLISSFHKDYSNISTLTFEAIDTVPSIDRPTVKPTATKQKLDRLSNSTNNWAEKS